ncbi:MAG: hypothetical protein ABS35_10430 [Kaistia sp. SCN 65-12]|nr:hypothetical protein [Devosia sp.]ODT26660.1 MAG: hypothetical protein ABS35_10430 [Kaistia sp. SCN 65-12]
MRALIRIGAGTLALAVLVAPLPVLACTLNLVSPGTLRNSLDNTVLGSQVNGNTPATVNILLSLLEGPTITVDPPTLVQSPGGYNAGLETREVSYSAASLGLFPGANQAYTTSSTSFATGVLGLVTLTMTLHNRVSNAGGFPPGTYTTRTVVTCHP